MPTDSFSSSNQRIAKNTVFLYIRFAVVMIVNLYTTRVVLSALGVEDYGIYNVVCGFVSMFGFLNSSITNGIQRFYNYELGRAGNDAVAIVYNTGFIIQAILSVVISVLLFTIGWWYLNNELVIPEPRIYAANWVFVCSIISLLLVVMQAPYSAAVIAYERMDFYALVSIVETATKLIIACALKYAETDRLVLYGLLLMVMQLLSFVIYLGYCKYNFRWLKLQLKIDKELFKSMFSFSGWNIFGSFAFMLRGQGSNVLLNVFFGTIVNAANGIASQVASAVQAFSVNIMIAFQPQLTQSYALGNYNRTEQLMLTMTKISYVLYCVLAIPIIVEMKYVLGLWLGNDVPDYTESFAILTIVIMGLGLFHTSITQTFYAIGEMKKFQITTSVIICSIIPIAWFFLRCGYAPESVYVVTIVAYLVNCIVCLFVLHKAFAFNVKRFAVMVLECALLTIIALTITQFLNKIIELPLIRLVSIFCTTIVVMSCGLWLTLDKSTREQLADMCKRKLTKNN